MVKKIEINRELKKNMYYEKFKRQHMVCTMVQKLDKYLKTHVNFSDNLRSCRSHVWTRWSHVTSWGPHWSLSRWLKRWTWGTDSLHYENVKMSSSNSRIFLVMIELPRQPQYCQPCNRVTDSVMLNKVFWPKSAKLMTR